MKRKFHVLFTFVLFNVNEIIGQSCQRNDVAVEENGRLCPASCTRQLKCRSDNKICKCDGECGLVCIPKDLVCPPLEDLASGSVDVQGNYTFGSKALYSCNDEYFLEGNSTRQCQGDATWSGENPFCSLKPFCSLDQLIRPDGSLLQADLNLKYFENESIRFICARGYLLIPKANYGEIICEHNSWITSRHSCEPKQCKKAPPLENGILDDESITKRNHSASITYSCKEGYKLIGSKKSICNKGIWIYPQGMPHCHNVEYEDDYSDLISSLSTEEPIKDHSFSLTEENNIIMETTVIPDVDYWDHIETQMQSEDLETSEEQLSNEEQLQQNGCLLSHEINVEIFHRDILIPESTSWLPEKTKLSFRCKDEINFQLIGSRSRRCFFSKWSGKQPNCIKIMPNNKFSPPLITYQSDEALHISNEGVIEAVVGSTLYLNCFHSHAQGKLTWNIPNQYDYYEEKWNDRLDTLTVIVFLLQEDDSGTYTCSTSIGRSKNICLRVVPFIFTRFSESQLIMDVGSIPSVTSCEFKLPPNMVGRYNGADIGHVSYLPDGAVINVQCKEPTLYLLRGPQQISCHDGQWIPNENMNCERLIRNSEDRAPPVNVTVFGEKFILSNGTIMINSGISVILDCLWAYPEPGEGWYYPTWFQSTSTGDFERPAEIIQHDVPSKYGRFYSYRLSFTSSKEKEILTYTCMATSGLKTQVSFKITDYCLLSTLKLSPNIEVESSTLKSVYLLGETIRFIRCKKGVLSGANYSQCILNGIWIHARVECLL